MGSRRGAHAGFGRASGLVPRADALDPVRQVQQLAVGVGVEIGAARAFAQNKLAGLELAAALGMDLVPSAVKIERGFAAHEFTHRGVAGVDERAFEIGLHFLLGILKQRLDGVGRLPQALGLEVVANAGRDLRMVKLQQPVDDIDPVNHEVSEDAAAEIPEPAPLAESIFVERLRFG